MKAKQGYVYFDKKRKRWIARYQPVDPITGERRNLKRYATTKIEANKKLDALKEKVSEGDPTAITPGKRTFADLAKEFEKKKLIPAEYIGEKKIAGRRELSAPQSWMKSLVKKFGRLPLASITHSHIEEYKRELAKRPTKNGKQRSVASINRELEFFRTMLNYAVTNKMLARNPFNESKGKKLIDRAAETKRERFPTFGEEMRLLDLCVGEGRQGREHLRPVLIVAADTGLRRNELFTLETSDLDFEYGVITVRAINAKTNHLRQIPMTRRVYDELKKLCEKNPQGKVFGGLSEVKRSFGTACRIAGIGDLHLHDFRHAFVSRSILAGVPPAVALKASGHASDEWKRYLNVTPKQLQKLFKPLKGQSEEDVKSYGLDVLRQLREALGYDEIANLIASLNDRQ
ncbi:MAG TPA: tyrosine-type recombinase/integrase [Candidatus Binatia bacterium]